MSPVKYKRVTRNNNAFIYSMSRLIGEYAARTAKAREKQNDRENRMRLKELEGKIKLGLESYKNLAGGGATPEEEVALGNQLQQAKMWEPTLSGPGVVPGIYERDEVRKRAYAKEFERNKANY